MSEFRSEDEQRAHLRECDATSGKAQAHKKAKEAVDSKKRARADAEQTQLEAESAATWRFLGAKTEQLWMLTGAVFTLCSRQHISCHGVIPIRLLIFQPRFSIISNTQTVPYKQNARLRVWTLILEPPQMK
jgi:methylthioribose-1-phosphate isomerase